MHGFRTGTRWPESRAAKAASFDLSEVKLDCGYRLDLLVEGEVIVEIKAMDSLAPIHEAQLMSYLKLSGCRVGLLIIFNVTVLKDGIRRIVNDFPDSLRTPRPLR